MPVPNAPVDWYTIGAILVGPILAVQISEFLQRRREKRERKVKIFKTLMSTRAAGLWYQHVEALNLIVLEFDGGGKEEAVRIAWKAYLDHLNTDSATAEIWATRKIDFLVNLLYTMSISLGYNFDKTEIKNSSYFPKGYGILEDEQSKLRKGAIEVLEGKRILTFRSEPQTSPTGDKKP